MEEIRAVMKQKPECTGEVSAGTGEGGDRYNDHVIRSGICSGAVRQGADGGREKERQKGRAKGRGHGNIDSSYKRRSFDVKRSSSPFWYLRGSSPEAPLA